jgi:UDP-N-acetylmuramyl tripeptide synthase
MFLDVTLQKRAPKVEVEKVKKLAYDWRYENSINSGKEPLSLENQEFKYDKWRTNSSLSNFLDTLMYVNEVNRYSHITDKMHYDYLFNSVRKKTRYGKKKTEQDKKLEAELKAEEEKIALISEYYKYNTVKSKAVLRILTDSQLEIIRKKLEKGGVK